MIELAPGLTHVPNYLDRAQQQAMVDDVRAVVRAAPLFVPTMPRTGKPYMLEAFRYTSISKKSNVI